MASTVYETEIHRRTTVLPCCKTRKSAGKPDKEWLVRESRQAAWIAFISLPDSSLKQN